MDASWYGFPGKLPSKRNSATSGIHPPKLPTPEITLTPLRLSPSVKLTVYGLFTPETKQRAPNGNGFLFQLPSLKQIAPENRPKPNRKGSYSKHPFVGRAKDVSFREV